MLTRSWKEYETIRIHIEELEAKRAENIDMAEEIHMTKAKIEVHDCYQQALEERLKTQREHFVKIEDRQKQL